MFSPLAEATLKQPRSDRHLQSPLRSNELHDGEATQVDEEQCEDKSSQKHAEAQPEETDHANAPVEFWSFPDETVHLHNVQPRNISFVPTDATCSIPVCILMR